MRPVRLFAPLAAAAAALLLVSAVSALPATAAPLPAPPPAVQTLPLPTIKVEAPGTDLGYMIVNESDFDARVHTPFVDSRALPLAAPAMTLAEARAAAASAVDSAAAWEARALRAESALVEADVTLTARRAQIEQMTDAIGEQHAKNMALLDERGTLQTRVDTLQGEVTRLTDQLRQAERAAKADRAGRKTTAPAAPVD